MSTGTVIKNISRDFPMDHCGSLSRHFSRNSVQEFRTGVPTEIRPQSDPGIRSANPPRFLFSKDFFRGFR